MLFWFVLRRRVFLAWFYYKAVFGFVLLLSYFVFIFNLSKWGDVGVYSEGSFLNILRCF